MTGKKTIDFLDRKKQLGFTGCVKMVFENGKLSLITEANHLEIPRSKLFSQNEFSELVARTEEDGFCGALVFFYSHGEINFYSFSRNYRGDALEAVLNS